MRQNSTLEVTVFKKLVVALFVVFSAGFLVGCEDDPILEEGPAGGTANGSYAKLRISDTSIVDLSKSEKLINPEVF